MTYGRFHRKWQIGGREAEGDPEHARRVVEFGFVLIRPSRPKYEIPWDNYRR